MQLILLAALYAPISQLNLSPVYGEIPAGYFHRYGLTASTLIAFLLRGYLPMTAARLVTPFCFWVPTIQLILFQFSSVLGNPWGPLITESLTCYPIVIVTIYAAMQIFDDILGNQLGAGLGEVAPSIGLFMLFQVLHQSCKGFIASATGPGFLRSRIGMQLLVGSLYGMVIRNSILWPALPAVAVTLVANPHCGLTRTTELLNGTLALYDYTLLERKESITGYISVIEDNQKGFRAMRCDHSLLGGEWKMAERKDGSRRIGEPVYSIFVVLEAVRLVTPSSQSSEKTALNIGLGVGTAPAALIQHGINTTIMELDPVVHEFALKYFNFPHNHSYYIGDAVHAVTTANSTEAESYDYIIHDVFTGGAEPVALFTYEFLSGLHMLLKNDGVIAINYAGDLAMPAASIIYRTITSVFPSCRVFREDQAPAPGVKPEDFTNMVFFCRKTANTPIKFRKPVEADFLGSSSRKEYLLPKHEILASEFVADGDVLRQGKTKELEKWHGKSAIGHWKVMRTVVPAGVWESW
jgi:spermidine synthase